MIELTLFSVESAASSGVHSVHTSCKLQLGTAMAALTKQAAAAHTVMHCTVCFVSGTGKGCCAVMRNVHDGMEARARGAHLGCSHSFGNSKRFSSPHAVITACTVLGQRVKWTAPLGTADRQLWLPAFVHKSPCQALTR
jgi:hypothetical protein